MKTPVLPPVGYLSVNVEDDPAPFRQPEQTTGSEIENAQYRLTLDDGTLTLHDKRSGRCIPSFFTLEDCADAGDSYDFSPLAGETPTRCDHFTLIGCLKTPLVEKLIVEATLFLPPDLAGRRILPERRYPFVWSAHYAKTIRTCTSRLRWKTATAITGYVY